MKSRLDTVPLFLLDDLLSELLIVGRMCRGRCLEGVFIGSSPEGVHRGGWPSLPFISYYARVFLCFRNLHCLAEAQNLCGNCMWP